MTAGAEEGAVDERNKAADERNEIVAWRAGGGTGKTSEGVGIKGRLVVAAVMLLVGFGSGLLVGSGGLSAGSSHAAAQLDRQAAIAKQDAERAISDLDGTVEQLAGAIGELEERLRLERERAAALEEHQRKSRIVYQQLMDANRGAEQDYLEAIKLVESLLVEGQGADD
jgi:hypothetical protein